MREDKMTTQDKAKKAMQKIREEQKEFDRRRAEYRQKVKDAKENM